MWSSFCRKLMEVAKTTEVSQRRQVSLNVVANLDEA
jgi:hypothetical protein